MSEERRGCGSPFAACALYLLASVGLWLVGLFGGGVLPRGTTEQRTMMINLIYYVPFLFVPVVLWATQRTEHMEAMRLNPIGPGTTVRTTFIALLCVLIVQNLSILWMILWQKLGMNVLTDTYVRPANTSELTLSVLSTALIAPVCEEMLFRGAIFSAWEPRGARRAVAVSAILFALLHGNWLGLPAELFGGVMLALLVLWTDSLYTGMIFHGAYNAALVILNYVSSSPSEAAVEQADVLASIGGWPAALVLVLDVLFMLWILLMLCRKPLGQYLLRSSEMKTDETGRRALAHHPGTLFAPEAGRPAPLGAGEILVLMAGTVSGGAMLILDILSMLGG
mgnify:CR=1 FL=1